MKMSDIFGGHQKMVWEKSLNLSPTILGLERNNLVCYHVSFLRCTMQNPKIRQISFLETARPNIIWMISALGLWFACSLKVKVWMSVSGCQAVERNKNGTLPSLAVLSIVSVNCVRESNHSQVRHSSKEMFLNFFKIHRKRRVPELLFNKVACLQGATFLQETPAELFSCASVIFLRTTF